MVVAGIRTASFLSFFGISAMKKFLVPGVALGVSVFVLALVVQSPRPAEAAKHSNPNKTETYMVIKVTDESKDESKGEKKIQYKAISSTQLKDEMKRAADDYKQKVKEWHDLKMTDPTAPMPKRIKIEKVKVNYETQKVAQEYADKLTKELEEGNDKSSNSKN